MIINKNITVIGLGEFGASVIEYTKYNSVLVDWRTKIFANSCANFKVKIRKNENPYKEVHEISNRLQKILSTTDIVFVIASTTEVIVREYAAEISKLTKDMGILTIAIITLPFKKDKARIRKPANNAAYIIEETIATVAIPTNRHYWVDDSKESELDIFDSLGNYDDGWELWSDTKNYDIKFLKRTVGQTTDSKTISQIQVATASIEKILKMLALDYINSTPDTAKYVLKTPGKLHITSAHNELYTYDRYLRERSGRAYVLERKISLSGLLGTVACYTTKMLLHLIVPKNITQNELNYLCEHIPGISNLKQFELAITLDDTLRNTIKAEVIGTSTVNQEDLEDWE